MHRSTRCCKPAWQAHLWQVAESAWPRRSPEPWLDRPPSTSSTGNIGNPGPLPATPAPVFGATAELQCCRRLGVTATLIREDGRIAYPVDDGIPVMLIEESIEIG